MPEPVAGAPAPRSWSVGRSLAHQDVLVPEQIMRRAALCPGTPALVQGDTVLTYAGLADGARRLAAALRAQGVRAEDRVAVCLRRHPNLLVAVLGVWLSGGAYLPTHPDDPPRRRAAVLEDADCRVAVVDEDGRAALRDSGLRLVDVTADPADLTGPADPGDFGAALHRRRLAYVLYTSGSTGKPKGVLVEHAGIAEFVASVLPDSRIDADTRALGFASLGFDACVIELYATLSVGGTVAIAGDADRIDPVRLRDFCLRHEVNWALIPPQVLPLLDPRQLPGVLTVYTGGEAPAPAQVARWSAPPRRFTNVCGPTETVVVGLSCELSGEWDTPVPLGRPMPGRRIYLVDEDLRPVPFGASGELCIGGVGMARGYLRGPGQTAGRFVPDPFSDRPGATMYRTGDLARWGGDGQVHFLGRLDRQIKIRGQRAEIGEIEAVLTAHPEVAQAAVEAVTDAGGGVELVAYVSPYSAPDLAGLRAHCASRLPVYMVPGTVHRVAVFPLNTAGKVDLPALRELAGPAVAPQRQAPELPVAHAPVVAAWTAAFGAPPSSPDDDFFDGGGHSLTAMRLVAALRAATGKVVSVEDVFLRRTVAGLADLLATASSDARAESEVPVGRPAELTAGQRRLWFVDQLAPDAGAYNVAMAARVRGELDHAALCAALGTVAAHHEVLRWRIVSADGVPGVVVDPPGPAELPVDEAADVRSWLDAAAAAPFDLAAAPPWRARLLRLAEDDHVLAVTVHHAVFDGWSQVVYLGDLGSAYRAARRGEAVRASGSARFADYAHWRAGRTEVAAGALDWVVRHLGGADPVLDLPRDLPRPPVKTFRGESRRRRLDPVLSSGLRALAAQLGTTSSVVLLAVFGQLLRRLTGRHDLLVGTPVADRQRAEFHDTVGLLLDMVSLRLRVQDEGSFADHVLACREELLAAMSHREAPMERVVERLGGPRDLSRTPLFQVLFNVINTAPAELDLAGTEVELIPPGVAGSPFDLTLYVSDVDTSIELTALYGPDLYRPARIEALLASFATLAADLLAAPGQPVRRATLRPATSRLPAPGDPLPPGETPDVLARVLAACRADPAGIAVAGPGTAVTRDELARQAGAVVTAAREAGLGHGDPVVVLAERDSSLPGLLLGVLAFGGRYAVLDATAPGTVLRRQAEAVGAQAILVCESTEAPAELSLLPRLKPADGQWPVGTTPAGGTITMTSGTTATARAVTAGWRPLAHFLDWYPRTWRLTAQDRFALLAGIGHDPVNRDVFLPLVLGATLHVPAPDVPRDPERLLDWLAEHRVTVAHLTPQLVRLLGARNNRARQLRDLRLVAVGGDQLTEADAVTLRALAPAARLVNVYGTTETPQVHAFHELRDPAPGEAESGRALPVGTGAPGSQLLVLDAEGRAAGVGELGEIVVRSRYLADGYLGEASPRRFLDTQGRDETNGRDDRMFRTGDLGRFGPDGEVVLAGRADDQLKIRGHRVEPAEVQAVLLAHHGVSAAAVVAMAGAADPAMAAYAVPVDAEVTAEHLHRHLADRLPEYAVPSTVTLLAELPLTANWKLDRAALPAPVPVATSAAPAGPPPTMTATERLVAGVWRAVLGLPSVTLEDSFFSVGGNSMAIVEVANRLGAALGRRVDVVDLFRYVNIRALAAFLDRGENDPVIDRAARRVAAQRDRRRPRATLEQR